MRVLVVDHHDSYTFNLVHLIAGVSGELPDVVQHDNADAAAQWRDGYTHVVLSPGPGRAADPADFALGRAVISESTVPVLGVCLGMQGIVHQLGGLVEVVDPAHGELATVGHCGQGLFASIPQGFTAVRYHSQAAVKLPPELAVTAWTDGAGEPVVMAVSHRSRPLHGVQFHPESVLTEHGGLLVRNFLAM